MARRTNRQPNQRTLQAVRKTAPAPVEAVAPIALVEAIREPIVISRTDGRSAVNRLNLQTLELVASPFHSFRDVGRFHEAIVQLPGVQAVQPRQLQQGALQLRIECRSATELLESLAESYHVPFYLVSQEAHQAEIVFEVGKHAEVGVASLGA